MKYFMKSTFALGLAIALTGCGGGEDTTSTASTTSPIPAPTTTPLTSGSVATVTLRANPAPSGSAPISTQADANQLARIANTAYLFNIIMYEAGLVNSNAFVDRFVEFSVGTVQNKPVACTQGGTVTLTTVKGRAADLSINDSFTMDYNNCKIDSYTFNGRNSVRFKGATNSTKPDFAIEIVSENFGSAYGGETISEVTGILNWTLTNSGTSDFTALSTTGKFAMTAPSSVSFESGSYQIKNAGLKLTSSYTESFVADVVSGAVSLKMDTAAGGLSSSRSSGTVRIVRDSFASLVTVLFTSGYSSPTINLDITNDSKIDLSQKLSNADYF